VGNVTLQSTLITEKEKQNQQYKISSKNKIKNTNKILYIGVEVVLLVWDNNPCLHILELVCVPNSI
jgi:hypothetical protein